MITKFQSNGTTKIIETGKVALKNNKIPEKVIEKSESIKSAKKWYEFWKSTQPIEKKLDDDQQPLLNQDEAITEVSQFTGYHVI